MRGIFRLTTFKDVLIVSGSGVGGGSLGYANTLYRARPAFFTHPQWDGLAEDWDSELRPHYDTAERMLGVTTYEGRGPADELLRQYAEETGVRRDLDQHPGRRLLRPRRRRGARPVLRRRGTAAHRVRPLRPVHDRLSLRSEEHAPQELPVVCREARRRDPLRTPRRRRTAARDRRRLGGLRDHDRARRGDRSQEAPDVPRAGSRPGCRRAWHEQAPSRRQAPRLARASIGSSGPARPHELRVDPGRTAPRTRAATSPSPSRSPRRSTRTPTPTSRSSRTERAATRSRVSSR